MQWPRIAFAFMLILALVPALSVTPSKVSSQGYVTITTQTTTTGLYTSAATTRYQTTALTTTNTYFSGLLEIPGFSIDPLSGRGCGWTTKEFTASKGQMVSVLLTSPTPVGFYVMSDVIYQGWTVNGVPVAKGEMSPCHGAPPGVWIAKDHITSYSATLEFPADGLYWLVFFNLNLEGGNSQGVLADFEFHSLPIIFTTTTSSINYVTAPTTELLALTTTAISQVGLPVGNLGLIGAIVAVAVIASVLIVARRRKPSVAATLVQERPTTLLEPPREAVAPQSVTPTKTTQPQPVISEIPPIISTGYVDLDKALNGGIPEEFAVVIVSPSFDERDLLLRKVVNSAQSSGRLAILISNDMGRTKDMASRYPNGFYALSPQADRISQHGSNLLKIPSIENLSDANISLGLVLKDVLAKEKATKRIMIIDILSDLLLRYKSIVTRRWLTDFVGKRKAEGFTVIATLNPLTTTKEETQNIIDFFDGVIEIFEKPLMERSRRFLMIRKMYGQKYSDSEVLMDRDKLF
jgi:KaiC/GvpD/RAD55 family RecA-like ATPase